MAIVTGVHVYRGIVELQSDGAVIAHIRAKDFQAFPLEIGEAFDDRAYLDKLASMQMHDACEYVLSSLEKSEKTKSELRKLLTRKGIVPQAADAAIEYAVSHRFVDDARYAGRVTEKGIDRNLGVCAIKRKLRAKGISESDVEAAVGSIDDEQQKKACRQIYDKIKYKYSDLPSREGRAKASQALARRGFSWDVISSVLDTFDDDD